MTEEWKPTKNEMKEILDTPLGQVLNGLEHFMLEKNTEELKITCKSEKIEFVLIGKPISVKRKSKSNKKEV